MNNVHHKIFESEYFYGAAINKQADKNSFGGSVKSRIYASAMSAFAAFKVTWDLLYMSYHTLAALKFAIVNKTKPIAYCDTRRNYKLTVSEFGRHIRELFCGSLVGIFA